MRLSLDTFYVKVNTPFEHTKMPFLLMQVQKQGKPYKHGIRCIQGVLCHQFVTTFL